MTSDDKTKKEKLTIKQRKFVDKYVEIWNATESASQVYDCKNRTTASAIGTENLWKPLIERAIEDRLNDAKNMIYTIAMTAEKDDTKLRASQDIVDRIEGKPTQKVEAKVDWELSINIVKYSWDE